MLGLAKDTAAAAEIVRTAKAIFCKADDIDQLTKHFADQHSRRLKGSKCLWHGCRREGVDLATNAQVRFFRAGMHYLIASWCSGLQVKIHYINVHASETVR